MKRLVIVGNILVVAMLLFVSCATPQVIKETVVVEKQVEKVITQVVKETVVVEGTPVGVGELWYDPAELGKTWMNICPDTPPTYGGTMIHTWGCNNLAGPGWLKATHGSYIFSQLVRLNTWDEIVPEVAKEWEISEDQKTYTFYLRNDVKFHDGEQLTAEDVKYSFEFAAHPDTGAAGYVPWHRIVGGAEFIGGEADDISGVEVLDDYTVQVTLVEPRIDFLYHLPMAKMLPAHYMQDIPFGEHIDSDIAAHPIGSGPFKFVEYVPDQYGMGEAYEDYWEGRPYLDRIICRLGATRSTAAWMAALQKGELHHGHLSSGLERRKLMEDPEIALIGGPLGSAMSIWMNVEKLPKEVRQAVAYALDREAVAESIWMGDAVPFSLRGVDPDGEWVSPNATEYTYDPDKAKDLLAEAGWDPEQEIEFLTYYSGDMDVRRFAAYQQYWADVGIKVSINTMDGGSWVQRVYVDGDYEIALGCCMGPGAPYQYDLKTCDKIGQPNAPRFCNEEWDKMVASAIVEPDPEKRKQLWYKVSEIASDEAFEIGLFQIDRRFAVRRDVCNFRWRQLLNVWADWQPNQWYLKE